MLTFVYSARDNKSGQTVSAEVQAENTSAAAKLLIDQGFFPISIEEKGKSALGGISFFNHVRSRDIVIFTRQMATLINAGLPLVQSLRNVQAQVSNKTLKQAVDDIIPTVEGGTRFSEALGKHPNIFNEVFVALVAAAETSGTLDEVLTRLADQQEKDALILRKIRGAMLYPAIVFVVLLFVVGFLMVVLMPQVSQLYTSLNVKLPLLTRVLVGTSHFMTHLWWLVLIFLGFVAYFSVTAARTSVGQRWLDDFKIHVPVFGSLFEKVYMARFARTLSTLLGSGIPMLEAMEVTKRAIRNQLVEEALERAYAKVKGGKSLSSALEVEDTFVSLVPQMIAIGEQSGALDEMLTKVAVFYEGDVDEAIKNLSSTIEPVMMVIMGVIVALVIAAVLLPIYGLVGSGNLSNLH